MDANDDEYSEDSIVCCDCIVDDELNQIIKSQGQIEACALCGKSNFGLTIAELASIIAPVIQENYSHGKIISIYDDNDKRYEEQQGDELGTVLEEVLGQWLDCHETLVQALIDGDPADIRDGGEPFFEDQVLYQPARVYLHGLMEQWNSIKEEIKHDRRFFSDSAKNFFNWLFEELENIGEDVSPTKITLLGLDNPDKIESGSPIVNFPINQEVFRGRAFHSTADLKVGILNPQVELAPPPKEQAKSGRMNAQGVAVFYGALDRETCVAELRPSIGGDVAVVKFLLTSGLKFLDFEKLENAYWGKKKLSYFQADFNSQIERRHFLRRLHRLISLPILPGHEHEYLVTQALAEYLAYVRPSPFDGFLFKSAQREDGVNVVIFSKSSVDEWGERRNGLERFPIKIVDNSLTIHQVTAIKYKTAEKRHFISEDGLQVHIFGDQDYMDDEE